MATGGGAGITVSELEEHFNLPQGSLDRECTKEHARSIARQLGSWERVAAELGLKEPQIEAIKRNNDSEEGRREAALMKWKELFAFKATNRKIVEALLAIERTDLGCEMCKLIAPQQDSLNYPSNSLRPQLTTQQEYYPRHSPPLPSQDLTPSPLTSPEPTPPQSSSGISVGSDLHPPLELTFAGPLIKSPAIKKIERRFAEVVKKVEESYKQRNIPLEKLQQIASDLPVDQKGQFGKLFKNELSKIHQAKTIIELFAILSYFWDYLQPDLLEYIVEQIDNQDAQKEMTDYSEELSKFRKEVTLQQYIGERRCNLDDDDHYQISIRLGNEWHDKTLEDLKRLRHEFADNFSLLRLVPKLNGVESNSITVIFTLPRSVVLNHGQLCEFFQGYNALEVVVDGQSIFNVEHQESSVREDSDNVLGNIKGESQEEGIMAEEKRKLKEQHCTFNVEHPKNSVQEDSVNVLGNIKGENQEEGIMAEEKRKLKKQSSVQEDSVKVLGKIKGESREEGIMAEEKRKLKEQYHTSGSGGAVGQVTDWEVTIQGKKWYRAVGSRDVLIIVSSESLQGPDIVPRREVELTEEDKEKLKRLDLPTEQWEDEASIMRTRYEMDKKRIDNTVVGVERSKPDEGLSREYVLKRIKQLMIKISAEKKQGASAASSCSSRATNEIVIHYIGPGKRNTGDWCFEDGFITFREMADLYCEHFKGKLLVISTDCAYSGSWVKEFMKFLCGKGVKPCGHSAREKGILMKVFASCKPKEVPHRLLCSVRARLTDKNTGLLLFDTSEISKDQHSYGIDATWFRCDPKEMEEPCIFSPEYTWERWDAQDRIDLVRKEDKGQPAWCYVLLKDDDETIKKFKEKKAAKETINAADYGEVLKSGLGGDPLNEDRDWMQKQYNFPKKNV